MSKWEYLMLTRLYDWFSCWPTGTIDFLPLVNQLNNEYQGVKFSIGDHGALAAHKLGNYPAIQDDVTAKIINYAGSQGWEPFATEGGSAIVHFRRSG